MSRPLVLVCACLAAFSTLLTPALAQNGTGIFMGQDMVLRAGPIRQLSLNAHVTEFLYQPTSDHIAYVSIKDTGSAQTASVEYVTTLHADPETVTLKTVTGDSPEETTPTGDTDTARLMNWSGSGRYLVFEVDGAPNAPNDDNYTTDYYIADTGAQAFTVQVRPLAAIPAPKNFTGPSEAAWSPSQSRLLICREGSVMVDAGEAVETVLGALYDASSGQMHVLQLPSEDRVLGWQDEGHLLLRSQVGRPDAYFSYDVATDAVAPIPHAGTWPPKPQSKAQYYTPVSATTPKVPGLTLETDQQSVPDPKGAAQAPVWTVWLRRPSAPKPMSALAVAVVHDVPQSSFPDPNAENDSDPQPQWAPDGDAIAYLAHGDLFVAPLTENPVTAYEKVALGEKLNCAEERLIIGSNLKQIGLGLMQYTADNGEKLPAADDWQDAIMPYVKDRSLFNFAGVPVHYAPPQDLAIADMDAPADTPLATADIPCAHMVLFADGHVKAFDKTGQ